MSRSQEVCVRLGDCAPRRSSHVPCILAGCLSGGFHMLHFSELYLRQPCNCTSPSVVAVHHALRQLCVGARRSALHRIEQQQRCVVAAENLHGSYGGCVRRCSGTRSACAETSRSSRAGERSSSSGSSRACPCPGPNRRAACQRPHLDPNPTPPKLEPSSAPETSLMPQVQADF